MTDFVMDLTLRSDKRYDLAKFLRWIADMHDIFDNRYIIEIRALRSAGNLTVTTQAYRPDLISYDLYRVTDLWSVILIYNDLTNVEQIVEGTVLAYPSLADLESLYFRLAGLQRSIEKDTR